MMDAIGWLGFTGLGLFYWQLGSGKVLSAYIYGTLGALAWLAVGVMSHLGIHSELPSLVVMETMVVIMNIRGILHWRKERNAASG